MSLLENELRHALRLALAAGKVALEYNRGKFAIREKSGDQGPVTEADLASSRIIVDGLISAFPKDDILSEEEEPKLSDSAAARLWCIDPIDGTKDFIQKNGEWSILIGLVQEGVPVLGVVYQPDAPGGGKVWFARNGAGAWLASDVEVSKMLESPDENLHCGRRLATRRRGEEVALLIGSRNHPDPESEWLAKKLNIEHKMIHGSVGIKAALISDGTGDLYVNSAGKTSIWDHCAGEALLRESGGALRIRKSRDAPLEPLSYHPSRIQMREHVIAMAAGWLDVV
jgi:3'(2'), 5'-bisphosphate nucleotidase